MMPKILLGALAIILSAFMVENAGNKDFLKDEDAFFPIRKKNLNKIERLFKQLPIIRVRAIWTRRAIAINAGAYFTIIIATIFTTGKCGFLDSVWYKPWIVFTLILPLIIKLGFYIYITVLKIKKRDRIKVTVSDQNKTIFELQKYAKPSITSAFNSYNIYILNAYKNIYCLREKKNYYRVAYFDEVRTNCIWIHYYSKEGYEIFTYMFIPILSKEQFESLEIGTPAMKVQELNPSGYYADLWKTKKTIHCTVDGYIVEILYDNGNLLKEVRCEMI